MSPKANRRKQGGLHIIVSGLIGQHPGLGGITWHYLQYLLGLARLGHDVYYVEDSGEGPYLPNGGPSGDDWVASDCGLNVRYLKETLSRFGFEDRWAYRCAVDSQWFGLSDENRRAVLTSADLVINVSGTLVNPDHYRQATRLAYVDTDPVVTQVKLTTRDEFRTRVEAHDVHFSFGECLEPLAFGTSQQWQATRQPIDLAQWEPQTGGRDVYTTVMNWTSYEPLIHGGRSYGQKDVEFRRYLELPTAVAPTKLEVALGGTRHRQWETEASKAEHGKESTEASPEEIIRKAGWQLADADTECADLDQYRNYLRSSRAEWSVAKNAYVQGQPGWFSERSACYLASGRPVIVQNTGFDGVLPTGQGLLAFSDLDEAVAAIAEVEQNYSSHCEAARSIAEDHFNSDHVLGKLVDQAMA